MIIKQLNCDEYKGRQYKAEVRSDKYLSIETEGEGFSIEWVVADKEIVEPLENDMLSDWLDNPVAFGAFEGDALIGFDRYAYSNDGPEEHNMRIEMGKKL